MDLSSLLLNNLNISLVEAIENDKILADHCLNASSNTICVIAITGEEDKKETVDTLNVLKDKEAKSEALDLQYGWVYADQARDIINTLQLPEDYPSMFILHPSKGIYRNYIGSWSEKNLLQWLNQVSSGRVQAWSYQGELKINDKPEYVEPIIEEDVEEVEVKKEEPVRDEL
jgi:protein disulfide-isomerase A6